MPADDLHVLLIEDNPGDARLIEEMLRDAGELLQRVDGGTSTTRETQVHHEKRLSTGLERLSEMNVDVVLLDLGLPDSAGPDTLAAVVEATEFVPIVVLTGLRDEEMGIDAIQRGAQDYLVKDEVTSDLLTRSIHHAIERNRQEYERARQLEQLESLNRLNRISQDITHAVISTSSREDLEQAVCERLVDSDAYRFAWIGDVDRGSNRVIPRIAAGVEEGYLDEITITIDDDDTAQGPAGKAVRTHDVAVMQNIQTDPAFEPWREEARERDYRSSAAIPIVYEGLLYGVVNVYSGSPNSFTEPEVEILARLGDVIGHAIAAIERRDALLSDTVLELEFRVDGIVEDLVALARSQGGTIEFENLVQNDDSLIAYGRIDGIPQAEFRDVAGREDVIDAFRVLSSGNEQYRFELVTEAVNSLTTAVASHGGDLTTATIADGEFRFVVTFPPGRDRNQLVELVGEHCEGADPRAQRTVQRDDRDVSSSRSVLQNRLTEKQRTALETSFFAGFFDWPRTSTGEEVADRLGISPSTFTQHLRAAEQKFFTAVFEDNEGGDGSPSPETPFESSSETEESS